jgi:very-short-patch-repair endonuclease
MLYYNLVELKQFLDELRLVIRGSDGKTSSGKLHSLCKTNRNLYDLLFQYTSNYGLDTTLSERIFAVSNGYKDRPKCNCGNSVKYLRQQKRYATFCSTKCKFYREHIIKTVKEVCIKKYGVTSPMAAKEVQDKIKATHLKKYGGNPSKSKEVVQKARATMLRKYGAETALKVPEFKRKFKETCLKRYGKENPSQIEAVKIKVQASGAKTNIERYGVVRKIQQSIPKDTLALLDNREAFIEWFSIRHFKDKIPLYALAEELGVTTMTIVGRAKKHKIKARRFHSSYMQKELISFIRNLFNGEIIVNDRQAIDPKELDIYLPERNLAIEFNGLYWHSYYKKETIEERHKHQYKSIEGLKKGIQVLTIFSNEWLDKTKQEIWKNIIKIKLGKANRVYARKCSIKELSFLEAKEFFSVHHLQGSQSGSYSLGLYYDNQLISAMSFGKPRFSKKHEWEILRYATVGGMQVVGGASKLFKTFIADKKPKNVISYCDLRYGSGNVYTTLGFSKKRISAPSYWYFKPNEGILHNRLKFQKHKLADLLDNYNPDQTEADNMFKNGYRRIWDCGTAVYEYTIS